jgi:SAM-dependent methyltransferase
VNWYAAYLRRAAVAPAVAAVKQRARELLALSAGDRVLDIGCGPGIDTVDYAAIVGPTGFVVGLDTDPAMIAAADDAARRAGVTGWTRHIVGQGNALPQAPQSCDAVHCERLLQHLTAPVGAQVVREAVRVTRAGGRVVVADTDWATLSIDVEEAELERRLTRVHVARFANGFAGRQIPRLLRGAGLVEVRVEHHVLPLDGAALGFLLAPTEQWALATGMLTYAEWLRWRFSLARAMTGGLGQAYVVLVLASGTRP